MNHVALENGATHNRTGVWPQRKHLIYGVDPCLIEIVVGHETDHLSVKAEYDPVRSSAQMHRIVGDRLKNRPKVRRRFAYDDAQHFRSRRLLLSRFSQLPEQPRILDGDDGLVGKCLDKGNLFFIEWCGLWSRRSDYTNDWSLWIIGAKITELKSRSRANCCVTGGAAGLPSTGVN